MSYRQLWSVSVVQRVMKDHLAASLVAFALLLLVLLLCYLPVVTSCYGMSDDYAFLARTLSRPVTDRFGDLIRAMAQGRWLAAILVPYTLAQVHCIADLHFLRLLGIIAVALLATCFYGALRAVGWPKLPSFCCAAIAFTMPPFQVNVAWAITALGPLAGVLSAASWLLADLAYGKDQPRTRWTLALLSVALLFLALSINQPNAMFFWVFVAISLFRPSASGLSTPLKRFLWYLLICAAACALNYATIWIGTKALAAKVLALAKRSALATDPVAKCLWFCRQPLEDALNLPLIFPRLKVAVGVAAFALLGLIFYLKGKLQYRLLQLSVALAIIPLSYLSNLVVKECWSSYRTKLALTSVIVVYTFFALWGLLGVLPARIRAPLFSGLLGVCTCLCLFLASSNVRDYFVVPQELELKVLKDHLATDAARCQAIRRLKLISWQDSLAPAVRYDEFGILSCAQAQAREPMLFLLLREIRQEQEMAKTRMTYANIR